MIFFISAIVVVETFNGKGLVVLNTLVFLGLTHPQSTAAVMPGTMKKLDKYSSCYLEPQYHVIVALNNIPLSPVVSTLTSFMPAPAVRRDCTILLPAVVTNGEYESENL